MIFAKAQGSPETTQRSEKEKEQKEEEEKMKKKEKEESVLPGMEREEDKQVEDDQ